MNILITNDDGIDSPGMQKLAAAARKFGQVWVVGPDGQRSAMSHSYSWRQEVRAWKCTYPVDRVTAYACSGTPADCVRVGALSLTPGKPDLVLAGINAGYNIARDIQYSATLGAVFEASELGIPAIAFSQGDVAYQDVIDQNLTAILQKLINNPLPQGQVWNVNFPCCDSKTCKGIRWNCTVSTDPFYSDSYTAEEQEDGSLLFHLNPGRDWTGSEGTDLAAVIDNCIAVGPVKNIS